MKCKLIKFFDAVDGFYYTEIFDDCDRCHRNFNGTCLVFDAELYEDYDSLGTKYTSMCEQCRKYW
jgi:hypothetical protein